MAILAQVAIFERVYLKIIKLAKNIKLLDFELEISGVTARHSNNNNLLDSNHWPKILKLDFYY